MKNIFLLTVIIGFLYSSNHPNTTNTSGNIVLANDTCLHIDECLTTLSPERSFSGALLIVKESLEKLMK